ncbi:MAG: AAA family ATPase [Lachnospiraceae bacterium]|nr:AAA family ATPase [Lachnospiraceae bacterium]
MGNQTEFIGTAEAARLLQMTGRRVVGLCGEGKLPGAIRSGRKWKIPVESVKKFMDNAGIKVLEKNEDDEHSLLPFAIGNTSYIEISSKCYYVDKTLLIRDLIDDHNMVTLFTRPRRFGKTLAINMIKTFFEKTNDDTAKYFINKKIWQCGEKYRSLQGFYPVIMLTFKDVKYNTWEESLEAIGLLVKDEFKRHPELSESRILDADAKNYIGRVEKGILSSVELQRSLLNLTHMLSAHHGTKVVILIDEYDTPIQQGYSRGFYNEIISFMRNFLSGGLKDNTNLAFGVLTGIMRISKENLFSGLNNPIVNTVIDEKYSEYFGFTEEEVREMALYYHRTSAMDEMRSWYDGYRFGNTEIYNPWSVTNYLASGGQAKPYWANTSDNEIIRDILTGLTPEIAEDLAKVVQGEEIYASLDMEVVYPRMTDGNDTIFSFLLLAGYLTPAGITEETESGTFAFLRLPNAEIRRIYNTEILSWIRMQQSGNIISEIEKSVYLNDAKRLQESLRKYMIRSISFFDGATEGFYHGMVLGLVASLSSKYYIRSNREAGEGRYDLQLEPKDKKLPGILMEFKTVSSSGKDKLAELAEDALAQTKERNYGIDLEERGINDIVRYGIAFSGKYVEVRVER